MRYVDRQGDRRREERAAPQQDRRGSRSPAGAGRQVREGAKDKIAETTPAVHSAVDKAADATKSGVEAASGKAQDSLDFVAKKATPTDDVETADSKSSGATPTPEV